MLVTIIRNLYVITLGIDIGTDMGYLYGSSGVSNDVNIEGLLLGDSLGSTDGKLLGSDEGIKLGLYDGKVLGYILVNVDGITL